MFCSSFVCDAFACFISFFIPYITSEIFDSKDSLPSKTCFGLCTFQDLVRVFFWTRVKNESSIFYLLKQWHGHGTSPRWSFWKQCAWKGSSSYDPKWSYPLLVDQSYPLLYQVHNSSAAFFGKIRFKIMLKTESVLSNVTLLAFITS